MKNLLLFVAFVLVTSTVSAQVYEQDYRSWRIKGNAAGDTTLNSKADTSAAVYVGAAQMVSLKFTNVDRFSIANVIIDAKARGGTYAAVDSLVAFSSSADGSTVYHEYIIRGPTVDKILKLDGAFRVVTRFAGSGNDNKKFYIDVKFR